MNVSAYKAPFIEILMIPVWRKLVYLRFAIQAFRLKERFCRDMKKRGVYHG